jgi:hypothetical protein
VIFCCSFPFTDNGSYATPFHTLLRALSTRWLLAIFQTLPYVLIPDLFLLFQLPFYRIALAAFELLKLRITEHTYGTFVKECADSVSANLWICSRCGVGSFGLERGYTANVTSCTTNCNWSTVSRTKMFTPYLRANPHIQQLAVPFDQPQRVRVCPTCCNPQEEHKAAHFPVVPTDT